MYTAETSFDEDLLDAVIQFFADQCPPAVVAQAESGGVPRPLWSDALALGFPMVGIDEAAGGSGGTVLDTVAVLRGAARSAAPLPLLEHSLAAWLLARSGGELPAETCATVAVGDSVEVTGGTLRGRIADVAFAVDADVLVVLLPETGQVALVQDFADGLIPGRDIAGMDRDLVSLTGAESVLLLSCPVTTEELALRAALLRAAQLSGVLQAVAELTLRFAVQREQFGAPIATFQAVQAHLVLLAQAEATVGLAVERAAIASLERPAAFEIRSAKLLANEFAREAARAAHQVHGAIGMTREYPLHLFTRRLHAWRTVDGHGPDLERSLADMAGRAPLLRGILDDSDWQATR
ncbi:acyl-CoA dehydrogenase [Nakamurella panacisegetis]|uniref:Acyl-CoA dehydrogenase n=1 Tax=Nakamurella panacisegetis TaxID=1090615 RepID=A0A1H0LC67_9ACTN|nr:acyl-CoA dehydrogenase [Nakamurella panacisegetis]SDO65581.1 acyl-CoA dehydrogenase [Nakamurella panacisegetis]